MKIRTLLSKLTQEQIKDLKNAIVEYDLFVGCGKRYRTFCKHNGKVVKHINNGNYAVQVDEFPELIYDVDKNGVCLRTHFTWNRDKALLNLNLQMPINEKTEDNK